MLLAIFFIIANAIFRGSLNYLTLHYPISIGLIIGILMSNSLLLIISLPVLAGCITMIIFDRHFNSSFFEKNVFLKQIIALEQIDRQFFEPVQSHFL